MSSSARSRESAAPFSGCAARPTFARVESPAAPTVPPDQDAVQRARARMERSSSRVLDHSVRSLLERLLQQQLPAVPLYTNTAADEMARAAGADALAFPDRIVFRRHTYNPQSAAGLALLGHELTHVAAMRRQPTAQALSEYAHTYEEQTALTNERALLATFTTPVSSAPATLLPPDPAQRPAGLPAPGYSFVEPPLSSRGAAPPGRPAPAPPRAAASTRDVAPAPPPAPGLSETELRRIKEELYSDLLRRIRTDFERGA